MQLWGPDNTSEAAFYLHTANHGRALCDVPITETGHALVELVAEACETDTSWEELSAVKTGFEPIILLACRHWRTPVPPEIYIASLRAAVDDQKKNPDPLNLPIDRSCSTRPLSRAMSSRMARKVLYAEEGQVPLLAPSYLRLTGSDRLGAEDRL